MAEDYRIVFRANGGPEVLEVEKIEPVIPGPGEIRIRQTAIGLNFIDIYHRTGLYPGPLPSGIGSEAVGVVEAAAPDVTDFAIGDRVGYVMGPPGAYASVRTVCAATAVPIPQNIPDELAAAVLLKGMTTEFLVERCARIAPGQSALVHAAAGGVGSLLVQWLKAAGIDVFAHTGCEAKADAVRALGIERVSSCALDEVAGWVRQGTGGKGVDVVFDGVGAASWQGSLASVARRGLIISYGNASGPVPPVAPLDLTRAGSIFMTRPTLADYCSTSAERHHSAERLFQIIASGAIRADAGRRLALRDAASAHRALASRATTGSTVLVP